MRGGNLEVGATGAKAMYVLEVECQSRYTSAGTICRNCVELLHFLWLSMTWCVSFIRYKGVQWYTAHPVNSHLNISFLFSFPHPKHSDLQLKYSCQLPSISFLAPNSHMSEDRWEKLQCSRHTSVLWSCLCMHMAYCFCGFFFLVLYWSKKYQIPSF